MQYVLVAVKDRALDAFMRPFVVRARQEAVRSFIDETNRSDSEIAKHPDDYDLYQLGVWDDATGKFVSNEVELLLRGKDALSKREG